MKALTIASVVSVLCTVSIWLFIAPPLLRNGCVNVDGNFEMMVVFPTLLGLPASLVGAVAGAVGAVGAVGLLAPAIRRLSGAAGRTA